MAPFPENPKASGSDVHILVAQAQHLHAAKPVEPLEGHDGPLPVPSEPVQPD